MKNRVFNVAVTCLSMMAAVTSCVNEKYEMSHENLDLNATVFQEGLCIPLASTGKVRMDSLMSKFGLSEQLAQYMVIGDDGSYILNITDNDPMDLTDKLGQLSKPLNVNKVSVAKSLGFSLSGVGGESFGFSGTEFKVEGDLTGKIPSFDVTMPAIREQFAADANIREYSSKLGDINIGLDFDVENFSAVHDLYALDSGMSVPQSLLGSSDADRLMSLEQVSSAIGCREFIFNSKVEGTSVQAHLEHEFPKEVKSVTDLHVAKNAKLKMVLKVENPFFEGGSIVPHLDIDLEDIFHLADKDGVVYHDHIISDFILNSSNDWTARGEYEITGIVLDNTKDWKYAVNADGETVLCLNKIVDMEVSGTLRNEGLTTTLNRLNTWLVEHPTDRTVNMSLEVSLENLVIDDATIELNPISTDVQESFSVDFPEIMLPDGVASVESVTFSEESAIDFLIDANNLSNVSDLSLQVESMEVTFPSKMIVHGADEDNKVVLPGGDISEGPLSGKIRILGIKLEHPDASGMIAAVSEQVNVSLKCTVAGGLHTGDLPKTKDDDVSFKGEVEAVLNVKDFSVLSDGLGVSSEKNPDVFKMDEIKIEVPESLSEIQGLAVRFKGDPVMTIDVDLPNVHMDIGPYGDEGLKIKLPEMLKLKTDGSYPYLRWFDNIQNALIFPQGTDMPDRLELPLECLVINPVKEDGKCYTKGAIEVTGGIGILPGEVITKQDLDILSGEQISFAFNAVIPAMEVDGVSMQAYSSTIEQTVELAPFKTVSLPEQVTYIDRLSLKDVYLSIEMKSGEDFPELGENAVLSFGADITLPDFIVVDDPRYNDGKLSVRGVLERQASGQLTVMVEPVKIIALQIEKSVKDLSSIKGDIRIEGNVNISGATLDTDQWLGGKSHKIDMTASVASIVDGVVQDKLGIGTVSAKIDYSINPSEFVLDMSPLTGILTDEKLSVKLDLASVFVSLGINTNVGIPMAADISLVPYYDNQAGTPDYKRITIDGAASSDEQKQTDIQLDLASLLYQDAAKTKMLDSVRVSFVAGSDPERLCVYDPSAEYNLSVGYAARVPLAFGKDFEVIYKDTITDLPEVLGTIMGYGGSLGIGGEVENSLPFNISMKVKLLDSDGNVVGESSTDGPLIKSADAQDRAVSSKLTFLISPFDKFSVQDIASMEFELKADTSTAAGKSLKEDSYIKIKSLYALVPQGINIDLSEWLTAKDREEENDNN